MRENDRKILLLENFKKKPWAVPILAAEKNIKKAMSIPTCYRLCRELRKEGKIFSIPMSELIKYGIDDKNRKHRYYFAPDIWRIDRWRELIEIVQTVNDEDDIILVQTELRDYRKYPFTTMSDLLSLAKLAVSPMLKQVSKDGRYGFRKEIIAFIKSRMPQFSSDVSNHTENHTEDLGEDLGTLQKVLLQLFEAVVDELYSDISDVYDDAGEMYGILLQLKCAPPFNGLMLDLIDRESKDPNCQISAAIASSIAGVCLEFDKSEKCKDMLRSLADSLYAEEIKKSNRKRFNCYRSVRDSIEHILASNSTTV